MIILGVALSILVVGLLFGGVGYLMTRKVEESMPDWLSSCVIPIVMFAVAILVFVFFARLFS